MPYASETKVPMNRTKDEIERTVRKAGATSFGTMQDAKLIVVAFVMKERTIRFSVRMPTFSDPNISRTSTGRPRSVGGMADAFGQEERRLWRAILLVIRGKLESIETGIESLDEAFLPHVVMADGKTVAEHTIPMIRDAIAAGSMSSVPLLPAPT
jgi:hypothetical protein